MDYEKKTPITISGEAIHEICVNDDITFKIIQTLTKYKELTK